MVKETHEYKVKKASLAYRFTKRFFDMLLSFIAIILLSWLFIIIIIIQMITSGFPIFYKDKRIGKNGKIIYVLKFRSMIPMSDDQLEKVLTKEQFESWKTERKIENDPRITKFGKFLRKTSIDELPQLFNIFGGSMSIVGPRPISVDELNEHFTEEEKKILLSARPGLISNWSVNGRSNVKFDDGRRQYYELVYFEKRSLWTDIKILFKVIPVVLSHKGAK